MSDGRFLGKGKPTLRAAFPPGAKTLRTTVGPQRIVATALLLLGSSRRSNTLGSVSHCLGGVEGVEGVLEGHHVG